MCRKQRRDWMFVHGNERIASLVPICVFFIVFRSIIFSLKLRTPRSHTHTVSGDFWNRKRENKKKLKIENVFLLLIQLNTQIPKINWTVSLCPRSLWVIKRTAVHYTMMNTSHAKGPSEFGMRFYFVFYAFCSFIALRLFCVVFAFMCQLEIVHCIYIYGKCTLNWLIFRRIRMYRAHIARVVISDETSICDYV